MILHLFPFVKTTQKGGSPKNNPKLQAFPTLKLGV
jgi:hypothetical protein